MILQDIRSKATELTKMIDDFVSEVSKDIDEKEAILTNKMKEYATLGEREKKLVLQEESFDKERALLKKEQEVLSEKQRKLELKEQDLERKIQKVNELMHL